MLVSLSAESDPNVVAMYEAGAMPLLIKFLDNEVVGMRAAAATVLGNIALVNDSYRRSFVELGGMKGLVGQLDAGPGVDGEMVMETIMTLQDVIEVTADDGDPVVIQEYADLAVKAGAVEKLRRLLSEDPPEQVKQIVEECLEQLTSAGR